MSGYAIISYYFCLKEMNSVFQLYSSLWGKIANVLHIFKKELKLKCYYFHNFVYFSSITIKNLQNVKQIKTSTSLHCDIKVLSKISFWKDASKYFYFVILKENHNLKKPHLLMFLQGNSYWTFHQKELKGTEYPEQSCS